MSDATLQVKSNNHTVTTKIPKTHKRFKKEIEKLKHIILLPNRLLNTATYSLHNDIIKTVTDAEKWQKAPDVVRLT